MLVDPPPSAPGATGSTLNGAFFLPHDWKELSLQTYLQGHRHPAFILPSPRLSSSSQPSLAPLWCNDAAKSSLSKVLEDFLSEHDQGQLKLLIEHFDSELDDELEDGGADDAGSSDGERRGSSYASFSTVDRDPSDTLDLDLLMPSWSSRRRYKAIIASPHPSFIVLHLHPDRKSSSRTRTSRTLDPRPSLSWMAPTSGDARHGQGSSHSLSTSPLRKDFGNKLKRSETVKDRFPTRPSIPTIDSFDWSSTPLGGRETWAPVLRSLSRCVAGMSDLAAMWAVVPGSMPDAPDWIIIPNSTYESICCSPSEKPHIGMTASEAWGATPNWAWFLGKATELQAGGESFAQMDELFSVHGQEAYYNFRWTPAIAEDGVCAGILLTAFETTARVISERFLTMSRDLSRTLANASTINEFSEGLLKTLSSSERDVPYAMLYHLNTLTAAGEKTDLSSEATLVSGGSLGLPFDHPAVPRFVTLASDPSASSGQILTPWVFREAVQRLYDSDEVSIVVDIDIDIPEDLRARSWNAVPRQAIVLKISNLEQRGGRLSFLIVLASPRRPLDSTYRTHLEDMQRHILHLLKNVTVHESARREASARHDLDKAKSAFFTTTSMALRNPLQLISGPLAELQRLEVDPAKQSFLQLMDRNTSRLVRLVDSLLDFSRIEGGKMVGRYVPVDVGALTFEFASLFKSAFEKARLGFHIEVEPSPQPVYADKEMFEKIITQLVANAFKYTLRGSVHISVVPHPDEIEITVTDTGVGVPKSEISRIAERFYRVRSSARSQDGAGIGLSLVTELLALMSGRLEVDSSTAEESPTGESGSTFKVFLRYGKSHLPAAETSDSVDQSAQKSWYARGIISEAGGWGQSRSGSTTTAKSQQSDSGISTAGSSSGRVDLSALFWKSSDTVLVVDSSADMRQYLYNILSPFCRIVSASNGEEALAMARRYESSLSLVISETDLDIVDGFGVLAALRSDVENELSFVPFILVSARALEEERVAGLLAGADDYLPKPFSGKELAARAHLQVQLGKRRKELDRCFREQSAATKLLSDASPCGISRWNNEGEIVYANNSWYEQTGHPRDKDLQLWIESIHPDHVERLGEIWEELFVAKSCHRWEFRWANGVWSDCQASVVASTSSLGGIICVLTDITDRKRLEQERKQAIEAEENHLRRRAELAEQQRREADEQKKHQEFLVSVVSHEVRNPVSAILQCAELCRANLAFIRNELHAAVESGLHYAPTSELVNFIDEDLDGLESINEMALSMERISNDVLSLGKIQLATLEVFAVPTDLPREIKKILSVFDQEVRMKGIRLTLDLAGDLSSAGYHQFLTDPVRLGQVLVNLTTNAIRFTDKASIDRREIHVRFEVCGSPPADEGSCKAPPSSSRTPLVPGSPAWIYGSVTDSGPGISSADLVRLFRRFSQARSSTHTVFGGSGLGLYVCRMIVQLMHGQIEVDSVEGQGSTFSFYVETKVPEAVAEHASPTPLSRATSGQKLSQPHVLVAEDNEINQKVLRRQLLKAGLTCQVASDGAEALELLKKSYEPDGKRFEVCLMDIEMPVMDGLTAVRHIRRMEGAGELPGPLTIFALTGNAREGQINEALAAGMNSVIIKPYRIDQVLEQLRLAASSQKPADSRIQPVAGAEAVISSQ